ncbi:MAG: EscU/YscU/HrcU family type III secretion system export apparatus switch protein [Telluria sp.]
MAEQDADLSESATPHKLDEARKKGSVAKSNDFTAMTIMAALAVSLYATGWDGLRQLLRMQQQILTRASRNDLGVDAAAAWMGDLAVGMLTIMGPFLMTLAVTAVVVNLFQTGPIFSFHPLIPDLKRISPGAGLKRIFSMRTVFESVKSVIKLVLLGWLLYILVRDAIPGLIALSSVDARSYAKTLIALAAGLLVKLVLALLVIGLLDLMFTRWEFAKKMRMSKRDVKDESKNREGDPRIRARIRELRQEVLKRSKSAANVPQADVLITNPTRIAVALSYQHGESGAPKVIAKGAGALARQMRATASAHQIPIVQNKLLARALFREVDYDGYVPEKWYPQVAKIMVWVYSMRAAKRATRKAV